MSELLPKITSLPVADIKVPDDRIRPVSDTSVTALVQVIRDYGFTTPLIIRRKKDGFYLVDGLHRITAARRINLDEVPVRVYRCTDDEAIAMETGQNLAGAPMSPLQDVLFLSAYKEAYLQMHPETAGGVAGALARHDDAKEIISFAKVVAEKRGTTVRRINQLVAVGRALDRDAVKRLHSAPQKITVNDLQHIAKATSDSERDYLVEMLAGGHVKNAAAARRKWAEVESGTPPEVKDPVEEAFKGLLNAWKRAPKEAQRRFVEANKGEIYPMIVATYDGGDSE